MFGRLTTITIGRLAIIAIAILCAFWFANNAAAQQQNSVSYSASPPALVSASANGQLMVLPQTQAGLMTATIDATGYTLNAQNQYIRSGFSGQRYITLNIISTCNIRNGCAPFGLDPGESFSHRAIDFRNMALPSLSMFFASGADPNEFTGDDQASALPIYIMAEVDRAAERSLQAISIIIAAGGNVNIVGRAENTMLHFAVINQDNGRGLGVLLQVDGISLNPVNGEGETPLDFAASLYNAARVAFPDLPAAATTLRNAGGRCIKNAASTDPEIVEICGT